MNWRKVSGLTLIVTLALLVSLLPTVSLAQGQTTDPEAAEPSARQTASPQGPIVSGPVVPKISPAVRDLPLSLPSAGEPREINPLRNFFGPKSLKGTDTKILDPLAANGVNSGHTPSPILNFDGIGDLNQYTPPDTTGDVGPNHYVQMVNVKLAVYDKSGNLLYGPVDINSLWSGFGGPCENDNDGDPIVLYDDMADRWMITQFAISSGQEQCVAVSTSSDPLGTYYLYDFPMPDFPDYPKFGVWPDAYYFGTNTGYPNQYYAHALDRANMLAGNPATIQSFGGNANFLMPADVDGMLPPPAGSPGYFYTFYSNGYPDHPAGVDRLAIYEFNVDWTTPANSTFNLVTEIPIAPYNYTVCGFFVQDCVPQPGTTQRLDTLSYWPMVRWQYRNFGAYESAVGNFTVDLDGTDKAAIRWFELRKQGSNPWSLYQEGTYAPDSDHHWMGSIAQDGSGNIALGYSVSSSTTRPAIRYATRSRNDPLGTFQAEASLIEGGGVQTGANRWGDYSSMTVDPTDQCTFWFTSEYHDVDDAGWSWNTRIGTFKVPGCTGSLGPTGTLEGVVTDSSTSSPIVGANIEAVLVMTPTTAFNATSQAGGAYSMVVPSATYTVTGSAFGYLPTVITDVTVMSGTTTTQNISLDPAPNYIVSGTVTDATTGWPLYASIDIDGYPGDPIWNDPVSGFYSITLPGGIAYTFNVMAWVPGYEVMTRTVGPLTGDATEDFGLQADLTSCTAPGYGLSYVYLADFEADDGGYTHGGTADEWEWGTPTAWPSGCADGDKCWGTDLDGNYENSADNWLMSPVITLTGMSGQDVTLTWQQAWAIESSSWDHAYAEITLDGGTTWTEMWSHSAGTVTEDWQQLSYNFTVPASEQIQLRWRMTSDSSVNYEGVYVDMVAIPGACTPTAGGLVVGNVYDDNTGDPLVGATVENEDGYTATTEETPNDPDVDDGFYTLFSPQGTKTFTATMTNYEPDVVTVTVVQSDTVGQDFFLPAGWLSGAPSTLQATVDLGVSTTLAFTLTNNGGEAADYDLIEWPGGFVPAMAVAQLSGNPLTIIQPERIELTLSNSPNVNGTPAAPWAPSGPVQLVLDDGSAEDSIGLTGGGQFVWFNRFTPDPTLFPFTLDQISLLFNNSVGVGDDMELIVWEDTDGDGDPGTGTNVLYYEWVTVQYNDLTTWNVYDLASPVTLGGPGDVLIGVVNRSGASGYSDYPAAIDQGASQQRSWVGAYTAGDPPEPPTLPADDLWGTIDSFGLAGNWTLRGSGFTGGLDVPWLSEDPVSGTVLAASTVPVTITFDASVPEVTQPGDYYATLKVYNDTPYGPIEVPVTMTVIAPATWGKLEGTVFDLGYCDVNTTTLQDALLVIEDGSQVSLTTDVSGTYTIWLEAGAYTVTVSAADHITTTAHISITAQTTTTQDFYLRWIGPCAQTPVPDKMDVTVLLGDQETVPLVLTNDGAAELAFTMRELAGSSAVQLIAQPAGKHAPDIRYAPAQVGRSFPRYISSPASVLIDEGFEDGAVPPPDWEAVVNNSGYTWKLHTSSPHSGSYAADVEYDPSLAPQDEWLLSPEMVLSEGTLSFWSFGSIYWCRDTYDNCDLNVWIVVGPDVNDGDDILVGTADDDWPSSWTWAQSVFTLTSLLPGGPVRIGFQYEGTDGAQIALDDILLDGEEGGDIPWLSEDPITGTVPADGVRAVDVTFTAFPTLTTWASYPVFTGTLIVKTDDAMAGDSGKFYVPVTMTVSAEPLCSFETNSPVTVGQTVIFTNTTIGDAPLSYRWDFGDGSTSTLISPTHVYSASSQYTVWLTATNNLGTDVCSATVEVNGPPQAGFTSNSPIYLSESAAFTNTTTAWPAVSIWFWNFGPDATPATSADENPGPVVYSTAGERTVSLMAINSEGSDTYTDTVVVCSAPLTGLSFSHTEAKAGEVVTFTAILTPSNILPTPTIEWSFGGTGITATHTFTPAGDYPVTVTATNLCDQVTYNETISVAQATPPVHYIYLPLITRGQ